MKIRIPITIDVDPQKWAAAFGLDVDATGTPKAADLRQDVRSYFLNLVQGSSAVDETDAEVTIA